MLREDTKQSYIEHILASADLDALYSMARELLENNISAMSESELKSEIEYHAPQLLG